MKITQSHSSMDDNLRFVIKDILMVYNAYYMTTWLYRNVHTTNINPPDFDMAYVRAKAASTAGGIR